VALWVGYRPLGLTATASTLRPLFPIYRWGPEKLPVPEPVIRGSMLH